MKRLFLLLGLSWLTCVLQAQQSNYEYLWTAESRVPIGELSDVEAFNSKNYIIVQLTKLPDRQDRETFRSQGLELLGYLGKEHYWARLDLDEIDAGQLTAWNISALARMPLSQRINPVSESLHTQGLMTTMSLRLWTEEDTEPFLQWLAETTDATVLEVRPERGIIVVRSSNDLFEQLAAHPALSYVGPYSAEGEKLSRDGISMIRVNALQNNTAFGKDLSGEDVRIGVWDDGLTGHHVDYNGHTFNVEGTYNGSNVNDHPTHIAGILAGRGHKQLRTMGMAPRSELYFWDFNDDIIDEMNQGIDDYDLNVINSSFLLSTYNDPLLETTCQFPGFYVLESAEIDEMVRENPTLTHVIANGNNNDVCQGAGIWSGIPIGLQSSKNVINVGWLSNDELFFGGSSVGPTLDGRLKPEVMAKGANVRSTGFDHTYKRLFGSSMAAPATAGAISLLYEWYFDTFGVYPDAALIRSVVCNTAFDLFFDGPDYLFGFGRVNALRAQEVLEAGQFRAESLSNGETKTYTITVGPGASQLNVGMAWTDKEAIPGALKTLVNDIDIKVIGPDATEYLPWTLNPGIPFIAAVTGVDSINNVEQVSVIDPAPGTYTVEITGTEVPFGPQEVALNHDILETGITVTAPVGGEQWYSLETQWIRWDAFGTEDNYTIDISYDDGVSYQTIGTANTVTNIPATWDTWVVKDTTSHVCRIRVRTATYEGVSGPFTIMNRPTVTGTACDRHISAQWNMVENADDYIIYQLIDNEYVALDTLTDTSYVISGLENGSEYSVAVQARDGSNLSARSDGVLFIPDGTPCNFSDDVGPYSLWEPLGFRYKFNGELPFAGNPEVVLKNYSGTAIGNFNVCYSVDGGSANCELYSGSILANQTDTFTFSSTETFADTLDYSFRIWTAYGADMNASNDTIQAVVKVVPSYPFPLPYYTGFEDGEQTDYLQRYFALEDLEEWDFTGSASESRLSIGRLQQMAYQSQQAMTLDRYDTGSLETSEAILNLNLNGYADSTIYLDFAFAEHLEDPEPGDKIWARADESEAWVPVFDFTDNASDWQYTEVNAINLSRILLIENGQSFGRCFQVRFGQEGGENALSIRQFEGRSFDDVRVYSAGEDVELVRLDVSDYYCDSLDGLLPVTATIRNNSLLDANNVTVGYETSSGISHTETLGFLAAGDSTDLTFTQPVSYSPGDVIEFTAYVNHSPDLYLLNDTIGDVTLVFQPFLSGDYYSDLESGSSFFADGDRITWELGDPSNVIIGEAASGSNAWVTNLGGRYNNGEESFILSPCFDLSGNTATNFAFNIKLEIEENFDAVSVDYSEDGIQWKPFITEAVAYNWFNGGGNFWDENINEWQTASNTLYVDSLVSADQVLFRITMDADGAFKEEGIGVDDIHLTEDIGAVYAMSNGSSVSNPALPVSADYNPWIAGGEVIAALKSDMSLSTEVGVSKGAGFSTIEGIQAQPRHIWVTEEGQYDIRFYLPYDEYDDFYALDPTWSAPSGMTILAYDGPNIDAVSTNNESGFYRCVSDLKIKPYRNGYILEFPYDGAGEFYVVQDGMCDSLTYINAGEVLATGLSSTEGLVTWESTAEVGIQTYIVEVGEDCSSLIELGNLAATGGVDTMVSYTFTDTISDKACSMCYQVSALTVDGDTLLVGSDTASFIFPDLVVLDSIQAEVQPNDDVLINWGSQTATCNDRYEVLVSADGLNYTLLDSVSDAGDSDSWIPYSLLDDSSIKEDTLCYTVQNYFIDGSVAYWDTVCVVFESDSIIENVTVSGFDVQVSGDDAIIDWQTDSESGLEYFLVSGGPDCGSLDSVGFIIPTGSDTTSASYSFTDSVLVKDCFMCYQVVAVTSSGQQIPVGEETESFITDDLVVTSALTAVVAPNTDVQLNWSTSTEACNDRFDLYVRQNQNPFVLLASVNSLGDDPTGNSYGYLDNTTPKTDTICYQLVQVFEDATSQIIDTTCVVFETDTTSLSIVAVDVTDVLCFGEATGSVDITISGGTPPYQIRWSDGSTSEDLMMVPAGDYVVVIEDALGATITSANYTIDEPDALLISGGAIIAPDCEGNSSGSIVSISVTGGTMPYAYLWNDGTTDLDIVDVPADDYQLTVTDANGCSTLSAVYTITEPSALDIAAPVITDASCDASSDGSIAVAAIGGTAPYDYTWDNGMAGDQINGLSAGSYVLTVEDANGCVFVSDPIVVDAPEALAIISASIEDAVCAGGASGAIDLDVAGGTPPYTYSWSNGTNSEDLEDVAAGTYDVTVTDANGCVLLSDDYIIGEPDPISMDDIVVDDATCFEGNDGAISITAIGGTSPYTFTWSNGQSGSAINDLTAGNYSVTVTDVNGCIFVSPAIVVEQPDMIALSDVAVTDNNCAGDSFGSIDVGVTGGTGVYTYTWSNGATSQDVSGLESGAYILTITDEQSCSFTSDSIFVGEPLELSVEETVVQPSCPGDADGSIALTITGGVEPYGVTWSTGSSSVSISDLEADTYTYTISDANDCRLGPIAIIISDVDPVSVDLSSFFDVACKGASSGEVNIDVSGGTEPYDYNWSNGATDSDLTAVPAGTYGVVITDAFGCIGSGSGFVVTEPDEALDATVVTVPESAIGVNDGMVDLTVSGGDMPYVFEWTNGAETEDISGLQSGIYCATITDANGCVLERCGTVDLGTAFAELFQINELLLYPNPAFDFAVLELSMNRATDVDLTLIGVDGAVYWSGSMNDVSESSIDIDVSGLGAATYWVRLSMEGGVIHLPLVIQR